MLNTISTSTSSSSSPSSTSPPPPTSYYDLPLSPLHSLSCGHIIFSPFDSNLQTTSSPPSLPHTHPKSPCSPNCTLSTMLLKPQLPLSWLKHTSPEPFICPQCVEECVRADYDMLLERSLQGQGEGQGQSGASGSGNAKEINVRLWTYAAMMEMVRDGARECQGTSGLFCTQNESVVGAAIWQNVERHEVVDAWRTRESGEAAGQHDDDGQDCCRLSLLLDDQDGREHGRTHQDVDDLADMLQDARVGPESGDVGMDELMAGVESLMT